jgi:hypothetical protein
LVGFVGGGGGGGGGGSGRGGEKREEKVRLACMYVKAIKGKEKAHMERTHKGKGIRTEVNRDEEKEKKKRENRMPKRSGRVNM